MAMLNFLLYDYSNDSQILDDGRYALAQDLIKNPPHLPDVVGPWWTVGALLKNTYSSNKTISNQVDTSAYAAVEPILYCVENNIADTPMSPIPHDTWAQALANICVNWYQPLYSGPTFANPLKIGWYWDFDIPANSFYGQQQYADEKIVSDFHQAARLAQYFGKGSLYYPPLIRIALGDLNWLLGMHMGVVSRHVQSAVGVADSDLERVGASFINGVGSHWTKMIVGGLHAWTQPTIVTGIQGHPITTTNSSGVSIITGWMSSPFSYSRADFGPSESYIKTDGTFLMGLDALGRVLHPFLAIEAENFNSYTGFGGGSPSIQSNNVPGSSPGTDRLNGGLSVVGMVSGNQLGFSGLMPPEQLSSSTTANNYLYRTRLRASNTGATTTVSVVITQGTTVSTRTFYVPTTAATHEYVLVDDVTGYSLPLLSGTTFSFICTCSVGSPGPCAIDTVVFESEGNGF
jgi:hypothetical protein